MEFFPFLKYGLQELPFVIITLLIAFTIHEYAHAFVAYKFGDSTAKDQGRLTLSPLAHLDPIGTIALFILGFGWAKPVPVNRFFFQKPRLAGVSVSLAGPFSNLILAFIGFIVWYSLVPLGVLNSVSPNVGENIHVFFETFISINIALFVFNLLPFPPLDGYRVVEDLAPTGIRAKLTQYEQYGSIIFLVLVITPLDQYTISPIFNTAIPFVAELLSNVTVLILNLGT
ncbi:site-2 protease family protein [Bacillus sp. BGMRC 2118]|nr:site-2 protease family protein [Bacillus sp. BGMRC 2118]